MLSQVIHNFFFQFHLLFFLLLSDGNGGSEIKLKLLGGGKGGCGDETYGCELWNGNGGGGGGKLKLLKGGKGGCGGGTYRCELWNGDGGGGGSVCRAKNEGGGGDGCGDKLLPLLKF